jgi:hypothetical protein
MRSFSTIGHKICRQTSSSPAIPNTLPQFAEADHRRLLRPPRVAAVRGRIPRTTSSGSSPMSTARTLIHTCRGRCRAQDSK